MAAGSAAERAEAKGRASARKRGREVVMTFSMQGLGNFTNTAVLCILLAVFSQTEPNKRTHVYTPWRFVCCLLGILCVLCVAHAITATCHQSVICQHCKHAITASSELATSLFCGLLVKCCSCPAEQSASKHMRAVMIPVSTCVLSHVYCFLFPQTCALWKLCHKLRLLKLS